MTRYIYYHPEGYFEIIHSNLGLSASFQYTDEAMQYKSKIPPPPEGYHALEDLTQSEGLTPAAKLIIRTFFKTTLIHCVAVFGGLPNVVANRKEVAKDAGKESIHHFFETRDEAVAWMMKNHHFPTREEPAMSQT